SLISFAQSYDSGKEYKYKFESYVYTSIRNTRNQCSGTATISDVIIQIHQDHFFIKINDIRFDVVNQQIDGLFEKNPFTFKDVKAFSDHISKPFKAVVLNGQIRQIYIGEDEPEWRSFGECDTSYTIRSEPSLFNSEKVLNITKVRNYEKCAKRPHPFRYASEISQHCLEFNSIRKPILQISAVYDYNMRGTLKNFVIEKVTQKEFISSTPYGKDGLIFDLKSKGVLELLDIKNITETHVIPDDAIPSTDLSNSPLQKNEFFDNIDLRRAHFLRDIYRYQSPLTQIVTLLDETVSDYSKSDTNPADSVLPSKYGEIIDALSTLDYEGVEQYGEIIDALSTLDYEGVEQVFTTVFDKSEDHSAVQESAKLKRTCYLTFSALVGKECVQRFKATPKHTHSHHRKEHKVSDNCKHHCNPEIAGKYFKAKEAIPFLKTYIKSSHTHYVRSTAVWKLMGMASNYPEEVRSVCVPVFYNKSEEQDLRIAGLLAWLSSGPSYAQLHLIAKQLLVEDNRQVVNMAYTTIKWLSESEHPCHKPFVKDLQSVLWLYKIAFDRQGGRVRKGDSRAYMRSLFDEQFGIGGIQHFSLIASNRSYVPNSVYIGFSDFIAGHSFDTFSLSIQSYGLEKVINRFFGQKGSVWSKASVLDIFKKRVVRDANPIDDELKLIENILPFETRESETINGDISLYTQGYTISYIDFDEQFFSSILTEENRIVVLRSEVGIPYFFEYKTLTQTNLINNKLSFAVQPALFSEDRDNKSPTEFRISTDFKYVSNSHKYAITGILMPVITNREKSFPQRIAIYRIQPMANPYEIRVRTIAPVENASTQLSIIISADDYINSANDNGFKVCAVASVKYPEYDLNKFAKLDTLGLDHTVNLTTRIAFGQNCNNESEINIKGDISQTDEQKILEKNRNKMTPEKSNPYATAMASELEPNDTIQESCADYVVTIMETKLMSSGLPTEEYSGIPIHFLIAIY
ncbi:unnamed protein product, partial [Oppiella nova]